MTAAASPADGLVVELALARGDFALAASLRSAAAGVTGVFGPSGSGKSTLLRCIAGLEPQCRGEVRLGTQCWQDTARGVFVPPHRRGIGIVFQDSRLFTHLSVRGNLDYAYRRGPAERPLAFDQVVQWLDLGALLARRPASLSGGERQRVALARSLLTQPRLLLLDEPLAALDQRRRHETLPYLKRLRDELAIPMLYVSHQLDELVECADRLLLLDRGRCVAEGDVFEVLARADLPLALADDAGAVLRAVVVAHDDMHHLTLLRVGEQTLSVGRQPLAIGRELRLRVHARDVALSLEAPQRTTLLNIIAVRIDAVVPAAAGQVLLRLRFEDQALLARITQKSAAGLGLHAGMEAYALIKGVALMR